MNFARDKFQEFSNTTRAYKFLQIKQGGVTIPFKLPLQALQVHRDGMSGLLGNCLGSLAMYSTFEPRGLSKLTDYGDKGLRVSHEFLNLNLQVPQVSFPSDVVLRFLSVLPISLMLRLQEGSVSPLTFLLARSTHQRLPF